MVVHQQFVMIRKHVQGILLCGLDPFIKADGTGNGRLCVREFAKSDLLRKLKEDIPNMVREREEVNGQQFPDSQRKSRTALS